MAIIKCPDCGKEISDQTPQCPNCGRPIATAFQQQMPPHNFQNQQPQTNQKPKKERKDTTLSIWAAVLGLFTCTAYIGGILAIIDLIKNKGDGKRHLGSYFALVMCVVATILAISDSKESENKPTDSRTVTQSVQSDQSDKTTDNSSEVKQEPEKHISEKEICFQETSWGISYDEAEKKFGNYNLMKLSGDMYVAPSVDAVLQDNDYKGIDFEYGDINICAPALNQTEIAGYTTEDINLYFVYAIEEGKLSTDTSKSKMYGARYSFIAMDLEQMSNDLKDKLIGIYGEPYETFSESDLLERQYTYIHWIGQSNTELMMTICDASKDTTGYGTNTISIAYAWRTGDELLQKASDMLKEQAISEEKEQYGNDNTSGL